MVLIDKNKVYGIILGHALGDALGTPVEFFPYAHYNGKLEKRRLLDIQELMENKLVLLDKYLMILKWL